MSWEVLRWPLFCTARLLMIPYRSLLLRITHDQRISEAVGEFQSFDRGATGPQPHVNALAGRTAWPVGRGSVRVLWRGVRSQRASWKTCPGFRWQRMVVFKGGKLRDFMSVIALLKSLASTCGSISLAQIYIRAPTRKYTDVTLYRKSLRVYITHVFSSTVILNNLSSKSWCPFMYIWHMFLIPGVILSTYDTCFWLCCLCAYI